MTIRASFRPSVKTNSALSWFCVMAAGLCLAPKAVSDAAVIRTGSANGRRHVSTPEGCGTLVATVSWAEDDLTALDVLRGLIAVAEVCSWFGGKMVARLNDKPAPNSPVARGRVRTLKKRPGF